VAKLKDEVKEFVVEN